MKKKHLIGNVKEFEDGYTETESNSSIYITVILMMEICVSKDTLKKPNIIVAIDGNFLPKETLTNKIYTSIDGIKKNNYR